MAGIRGRVLLAWEAGSGRGHIVTLKTIAEALGDRFVFDAALCRMQHAGELRPLCELVFPSAFLSLRNSNRRAPGSPRTATWADFLGDLGFGDAVFLSRQIGWWTEALRSRQSSLLIGDFAPCALLAAKALGIPAVATGTGYSVPPPSLDAFPPLLPEHAQRLHAESAMVAALNTAGSEHGLPPITRFAELYDCSAQLARTIPMLDPYFVRRTEPLLPPLNDLAARAGGGDEVFIYFSTDERDDPALMQAVGDLELPVRLYMPAIPAALAAQLAARGVIIEPAPLPLAEIGRHTRLMVHAGQHGSLCMALGLGVPQVAFPRHLEHLYHARRAAELGTVTVVSRHERDPAVIAAAIRARYEDATAARRAADLAEVLAPRLSGDIPALVRDRLLPLLEA